MSAALVDILDRLDRLEQENRELRAGMARHHQEQTAITAVRMRELARDVELLGWNEAMHLHGRTVYQRGRRQAV